MFAGKFAVNHVGGTIGSILGGGHQRHRKRLRHDPQRKLKEAVAQQVQACRSSLADPALNPIRTKVAVREPGEQTFAMRTNSGHASARERPIIALWAQKRDECFADWRRTVEPMMPAQIAAVINSAAQVSDTLVAQLYLGQITYGELAKPAGSISGADFSRPSDRELEFADADASHSTDVDAAPTNCPTVDNFVHCL